jgi:hypothetical protein
MDATYRKETTQNKYPVSTMKSALQKYIRRANIPKALYSLYELDLFGFHYPSEGKNGQGIHTNMIHRLMITSLEDVGPNHIGIFIQLGEYMNIIFRCRDERKSAPFMSKKFCEMRRQEFRALVKFVVCCCNSKKSREPSYYKYVYSSCVDDYKRQKIVLEQKPHIKKHIETLLHKKSESDFDITFDEMIKQNNNDANRIAWIWNNTKMTKKYFNSTKSQYYILFRLKEYIEHNLTGTVKQKYLKIVDIFVSWTKHLINVRENFLPWQVLLISLLKNINPNENCNIPVDKLDEYYHYITKNLDGERIVLDEYVNDMHTREGKRLNRGPVYFATDSSVVIPEDTNINYDYKELYTIFKYNCENRINDYVSSSSNTESALFGKNIIRAQLVCSNAKQDTYFAEYNGKIVFVKGPFRNESEIGNIRVKNIIKSFPQINHINFTIKYLVPDLFDKSSAPLGIRNILEDIKKPYPFMIMDDIIGFTSFDVIPKIYKNSKCWPDTLVVDFDKVDTVRFINIDLLSDTNLMKQYILNIMFKYILGIPDLADRNFFVHGKKIYSLDLDNIGKSFNIAASLRNKKYTLVLQFIHSNLSYFQSILSTWKKSNNLSDFEKSNLEHLLQNLSSNI